MEVTPLEIPEVRLLTPKKFGDDRGFFSETYNLSTLAALGIDLTFVQDNHVFSREPWTLRGLHFQRPPHAQDKLFRVTRGSMLDVAVDIRRGSPSYGRYVSAVISAENWRQILVPVGFAHGYLTLEPNTEVVYKVSNYYAPDQEGGLAWDDAALGIDWGVAAEKVSLSAKDRAYGPFANFASPFP